MPTVQGGASLLCEHALLALVSLLTHRVGIRYLPLDKCARVDQKVVDQARWVAGRGVRCCLGAGNG
eukprot:11199366-Alexandrium_andersonii.AAC.1